MMKFKIILALFMGAFFSCQSNKNKCQTLQKESQVLMNTEWTLFSIKGDKVEVLSDTNRISISFLDENKISGFAGCNHYFGSFTKNMNELTFGPTGATRMFCEETAEIENSYLTTLDEVKFFEIIGQKLLMKNETEKVILQFERVK